MIFEINTTTKTIEFEGQIDLIEFSQMINKIIGDDKGWEIKSKTTIKTITVKEYVQPYVPYVQPWNPWKVNPIWVYDPKSSPIYLGGSTTNQPPYLNPPSTTTELKLHSSGSGTYKGNAITQDKLTTNTVQGMSIGTIAYTSQFQA